MATENWDGQAKETCNGSQDEAQESDEEGGQASGRRKIAANCKESYCERVRQTQGRQEITGNFEEGRRENCQEAGIPS